MMFEKIGDAEELSVGENLLQVTLRSLTAEDSLNLLF